MSGSAPGLFEAVGVELEYMIVDAASLAVAPVADRLIERAAGAPASEVERGEAAWSNELVLHVLELKTNGPAPGLDGLAELFAREVQHADALLEPLGARLMPTGMHPCMDPERETRLWPHEYTEVYRSYDRIFDCRGHGWANLQSTHLNLPFQGDDEFGALHSAIRVVLPLIPALAASSPFRDGALSGHMDTRVLTYRDNSRRVPSVTGRVVPEPVGTRAEYERRILGRIYDDLAAHDPEGVLRHEWVNARGAIARFDRGTVEIRLVDAQESPLADLAVTAAIHEVVRSLTLDPPEGREALDAVPTELLADVLERTASEGDLTAIGAAAYLRALGLDGRERRAGAVWGALLERAAPAWSGSEWSPALDTVLTKGCLARRIRDALSEDVRSERVREEYEHLCSCLREGAIYTGRDA